MMVDFPDPLGPSRPKISPERISKLTRLTAVKAPNRFTSLSTTIDGPSFMAHEPFSVGRREIT
jgi:hypothetical protein